MKGKKEPQSQKLKPQKKPKLEADFITCQQMTSGWKEFWKITISSQLKSTKKILIHPLIFPYCTKPLFSKVTPTLQHLNINREIS